MELKFECFMQEGATITPRHCLWPCSCLSFLSPPPSPIQKRSSTPLIYHSFLIPCIYSIPFNTQVFLAAYPGWHKQVNAVWSIAVWQVVFSSHTCPLPAPVIQIPTVTLHCHYWSSHCSRLSSNISLWYLAAAIYCKTIRMAMWIE